MSQIAHQQVVRMFLFVVASLVVAHQIASATPLQRDDPDDIPFCPDLERLCEAPPPDGGIFVEPLCECGPGGWIRQDRAPYLNPEIPIRRSWVGSEHFVGWRTMSDLRANERMASARLDIAGSSSFWHAGSRTETHLAQYGGGWIESWRGKFPACARSVLLAAVGTGGLGISGTCAARAGCSASMCCTGAGMAASRGNASADLSDLEVHGTVAYDHLTHSSKIEGNFGIGVEYSSPYIDGLISAETSWTVSGQGSATGALSFTVAPDRTYCALTNLPIMAYWSGTVVASVAVTVDENGTAAGSAAAAITLSVQ